jgi:DNA-binding MarR family transcriptional regulator
VGEDVLLLVHHDRLEVAARVTGHRRQPSELLVERRSDPSHGRILRTQLSAAGLALLEEVQPEVAELEGALRGGATDAEVAQTTVHLVGVLDRLRELQQHRT